MKLTFKVGKMEKTVTRGERQEKYSLADMAIEVEFEAREIDTVLETCLDAFKAELREDKKGSMFPGRHSQGCCKDRTTAHHDGGMVFYVNRATEDGAPTIIKFKYDSVVYEIDTPFSFETFGKIASNDDELTQSLALEKVLDSSKVYPVNDMNRREIALSREVEKELFYAIVREVLEHGYILKD